MLLPHPSHPTPNDTYADTWMVLDVLVVKFPVLAPWGHDLVHIRSWVRRWGVHPMDFMTQTDQQMWPMRPWWASPRIRITSRLKLFMLYEPMFTLVAPTLFLESERGFCKAMWKDELENNWNAMPIPQSQMIKRDHLTGQFCRIFLAQLMWDSV